MSTDAEPGEKPTIDFPYLRKLLEGERSAVKNYQNINFLDVEGARRILTRDRLQKWLSSFPDFVDRVSPEIVIQVRRYSILLFSVLIFARLEYIVVKLFESGLTDVELFDKELFSKACASVDLTSRQVEGIAKYRSYVGMRLAPRHQDVPKNCVLPYLKREDLEKWGSFGVVYRVTLGIGYIAWNEESIVADKQVRAINHRSEGDRRRLFREVETLRQRQHPNIIRLLASFYFETIESESDIKTLHLLFPWADMDLATWMNASVVPAPLESLSAEERRKFLYRSIYELVSGLSYLHREIAGMVTSHHDLKPRNILIVNGGLTIADFGHSHLRLAIEGTDTNRAGGLGTYEYQPPEYWADDGNRAEEVKHGRAFDVWSMGCIIIELATLIVHGWESKMVHQFYLERKANALKDRHTLAATRNGLDGSFHNNMTVVSVWMENLKRHDGTPELRWLLDHIALDMTQTKPRNRLFIWEAEIQLYDALKKEDDLVKKLDAEALKLQKPPANVTDGFQNPFHRACRKENRTAVIGLWELGWPLTVEDEYGQTVLDILQQSTDEFLSGLESRVILLIEAARAGDTAIVRDLMENGISPLLVDAEGHLALYEAVCSGKSGAVECLLKTKGEEQLLFKSPTAGDTVLLQAASNGANKDLELMLKHVSDINAGWWGWETALFAAAKNGHAETVRILLQNGARLRASKQRKSGTENALHAALRFPKILKLLLEVEGAKECLEQQNVWGQTPIALAVAWECEEAIKILKAHDASLRTVSDYTGESLLHIIADRGCPRILKDHIESFQPKDFIAVAGNSGLTPLGVAKRNGHKEVAKLLRSKIPFGTRWRQGIQEFLHPNDDYVRGSWDA